VRQVQHLLLVDIIFHVNGSWKRLTEEYELPEFYYSTQSKSICGYRVPALISSQFDVLNHVHNITNMPKLYIPILTWVIA